MLQDSGPRPRPLGTPVERILERLDRVRRSQRGWTARCPTGNHRRGDRSPSLSVAEGGDGRVLLRCFRGCDVNEIVRAMGLGLADLFPRREPIRFQRPRRQPLQVPRSVAARLVASPEFAFAWELSKLFAQLPPRAARSEVVRNWDLVADRCDPRLLLHLAYLVRGVATMRYCSARTVGDPIAVARAVRRLTEGRT